MYVLLCILDNFVIVIVVIWLYFSFFLTTDTLLVLFALVLKVTQLNTDFHHHIFIFLNSHCFTQQTLVLYFGKLKC